MSSKLFVGGLSPETGDASLRAAFERFGPLDDVRVITDRETGRSRGFGFVRFTDPDHAKAACEQMAGASVDGRSIRVDFAEERPAGPGGRPPRAPRSGDSRGGFGGGSDRPRSGDRPPPRRFDDAPGAGRPPGVGRRPFSPGGARPPGDADGRGRSPGGPPGGPRSGPGGPGGRPAFDGGRPDFRGPPAGGPGFEEDSAWEEIRTRRAEPKRKKPERPVEERKPKRVADRSRRASGRTWRDLDYDDDDLDE